MNFRVLIHDILSDSFIAQYILICRNFPDPFTESVTFSRRYKLYRKKLSFNVRYLAKDKKNGMNNLTKHVTRQLGILAADEDFNSEEMKSKLIFCVVQALYSVVVSIPTLWLYTNYHLR